VASNRPRPTQPQIKRSQKRLIGFLAKTGEPIDVAAARLRVTRKQLENYLFQPVKSTRRTFRRSKAYQSLYEQTGNVRKVVVQVGGTKSNTSGITRTVDRFSFTGPLAGVKRIPRVVTRPFVDTEGEIREHVYVRGVSREAQRRASILTHSTMLEYRTTEAQATLDWQIYASEHQIPTSISDIKAAYQTGQISSSQVHAILTHWRQIYDDSVTDDYYDSVLEDFDDYEE
jgi:hypothetical protein